MLNTNSFKSPLFQLLFILSINLNSQVIAIGDYTDINGQNFDEFYSPFTYASKSNLHVNYNKKYEKGIYCNLEGEKIEGYIKFDDKKIYFKNQLSDFSKKIKAANIKYVKIGIDSFFTASNYFIGTKLKTSPDFLQYIAEVNNHIYAKHYKIKSNYVEATYLTKMRNTNMMWTNFDLKNGFEPIALNHFGHIPHLKQKIQDSKYTTHDLLSLIKTAEYHKKHDENTPIYFDEFWQETTVLKNAIYNASITSKKDSLLTFQYFKRNMKIFEISYSSFYPNKKEGLYTSYYPNGKIRKTIQYKENKPKEVKVFSKNNLLRKHYKDIAEGKDSTEIKQFSRSKINKSKKYTYQEKEPNIKFIVLRDSLGNNVVNEKGNFTISRKDKQTNRVYTNIYKDHILVKSYRIREKDTLFQVTKDGVFDLEKLEEGLRIHKNQSNFPNALTLNAQGTVFISVILDPKGYLTEYKVLNKIHPEIDSYITFLLELKLSDKANFRYKFKKSKRKPKIFHETIVPIEFSNNRYYRSPVSYDHFYHFQQFMWQQQQWQMQQSINNTIKNLPSPSSFGF